MASYVPIETQTENSLVKTWFDNIAYSHSSSENTKAVYAHFLDVFCDHVNKTPKQIIEDFENAKRDRDFSRKYSQQLRSLISVYVRKGYASGSIKGMVSAVRSFFKYNDLPLGHIPMPKPRIVFHNRDITAQEIREILKVSKPRERAFYLMMAQTGLRPDTLCHLKIKHVEPDFSKEVVPCKVDVPEELTKGAFGSYFTFMGDDAAKYLRNYLNTRRNVGPESYIFTSYGKTTPLHRKSISSMFARTLETLKESGVIEFKQKEVGKPRNVRLYNLRKFFRKYAGQAGIEYVNFWMGHKTDYQAPHIPASDVHYFSREDEDFQRELYNQKAMPHLRIETSTPTETDKTIKNLEEKIGNLEQQNLMLKQQLNKLASGMELSSEQLNKIIEAVKKELKREKTKG